MKRIVLILLSAVLIFSLTGCGSRQSEDEEEVLAAFTEALRVYDREAMTALLTEFPDNTAYVYLDDIFNDEAYILLYQTLYSDITYAVRSREKNRIVAEYTMPDVQTLYAGVSAAVLNLALTDETLQEKLQENDENALILIQQTMLSWAKQEDMVETMTQEYTLSFTEKDGKTVIVCDDELRALITGNFFLSKKTTLE